MACTTYQCLFAAWSKVHAKPAGQGTGASKRVSNQEAVIWFNTVLFIYLHVLKMTLPPGDLRAINFENSLICGSAAQTVWCLKGVWPRLDQKEGARDMCSRPTQSTLTTHLLCLRTSSAFLPVGKWLSDLLCFYMNEYHKVGGGNPAARMSHKGVGSDICRNIMYS